MRLRSPSVCTAGIITDLIRCVPVVIPPQKERRSYKPGGSPRAQNEETSGVAVNVRQLIIVSQGYVEVRTVARLTRDAGKIMDYLVKVMVKNDFSIIHKMMCILHSVAKSENNVGIVNAGISKSDDSVAVSRDGVVNG